MRGQWDKSFFKVIQQILMAEWDPISVKEYINTMDEYDRYAMQIYSKLAAGWNADRIAEYLADTESETMELNRATHDKLRPIAEHLIAEWAKFSGQNPAL